MRATRPVERRRRRQVAPGASTARRRRRRRRHAGDGDDARHRSFRTTTRTRRVVRPQRRRLVPPTGAPHSRTRPVAQWQVEIPSVLRRRPPHSVTMVRERVVCAIWDDDAPPTHVVTRVVRVRPGKQTNST
jgi:hypothetical protein